MSKITQNKMPSKTLNKQELFRLYAIMLHARIFEETCSILYTSKLIAGFCHLYSGQEAIAVGIQSLLTQKDNTITAYRCHVHAIIARIYRQDWDCKADNDDQICDFAQQYIEKYSQAKSVMSELMAKQTGCSKGKGGSMHLYDKEHNFYGGHGIVGIQIPLGVGLAFAEKYRSTNAVTFASLGEGAMNQGQVYEAMNMAALWKLPIVFVCENNGYAIGTSERRHSAGSGLYKRGAAFDIPSYKINGMDILEVIEYAQKAKEHALTEGPVFLEMDTYRYRPHSMSDTASYRTREEVNSVKNTRDPIELLKNVLLTQHSVSPAIFEKYEKLERERIEEARLYAIESPFPGQEELQSDIWASPVMQN